MRQALDLPPAIVALLAVSLASVPVTLTHSIEDVEAGVHQAFGLSLLVAAFLLSLAYALQVAAAVLLARTHRLGYLLNLALALVWLVGAAADHLDDVLFAEVYRRGLVSKALEVAIMVITLLWAILSLNALRRQRGLDPAAQSALAHRT